MRIVQLANLVTPTSGGIRTVLGAVGEGYAAAGHERHLIVPARRQGATPIAGGTQWAVPGTILPGSGGYRLALRRRDLLELLERLAPDAIEVSDRYTLTWAADWARARGVRSVALVHEHLADNLANWLRPRRLAMLIAGRADRRLIEDFDVVVTASRHTAAPFAGRATVVPLGVDLAMFAPPAGDPREDGGPVRLLLVGRLSAEKRPEVAIATASVLSRRGVEVQLDVIGAGPREARLWRLARGLDVRFVGHVPSRWQLAGRLGAADVTLCPCTSEGFGLAALESLACGTPIVSAGGGPADLLDDADPEAGAITSPDPEAMAAAVERLMATPARRRRAAARAAAERFPWARTIDALLAVHAAGDRQVQGRPSDSKAPAPDAARVSPIT